MSREEVLARLRQQLPRLRDYGVVGMAVFGEAARGELLPDAELEVVVDVDFDRHPRFSLLEQGGIHADLSDAFGRYVRVVVDGRVPPHLASYIDSCRVSV